MVIDTNELNRQILDEMRATRGWKLFEQMLRSKYDADVRVLVSGADIDSAEIVRRRARCKLISEIIGEAGMNKEERWTI